MSEELYTHKERLLRVLRGQSVDRPPVICIGGMMNAAIVDVMKKTGHTLPAAHDDPALMAALAEDVHEYTGFENIAVPFCMTIEAELLGSPVDKGTLECEPKIVREKFRSSAQVEYLDVLSLARQGRIPVVIEAIRTLAKSHPEDPVIVSITGPISTAASIVDPMTFYKELRKNPVEAHRVLTYVVTLLSEFAREAVDAGAAAVAIGDPSATGEILGPAMFAEFAVPHINTFADAVHKSGAPFILHICGDMKRVKHLLPNLCDDALSTDAMVSLPKLKEEYPQITTMGNVSTYALQWGTPEKIADITTRLVRDGVNIISPACGLSTSTSLANIRALTGAVKNASVHKTGNELVIS
jgi:[methyl-Co(III) methanol-specific corrinoid protein]:coenzyme M methyltransferase